MKTLFSRFIAGVVFRLSTRKTSVSSPLSLRGSTSFAKGGFQTSRLNDISSSLVSLVSSLCASSVKLSSCKHSSSSGIRNGSFVIRNGIGFTLVELMIVIAIIGVLAASLFPMMSGYMAKSRDTARQTNMRQILSALETFSNDHGGGVPKTCNGSTTFPNAECDISGWDSSGSGLFVPFLSSYMTRIPVDPVNNTNGSVWSTQQYFYYCYQNHPGFATGVTLAWRSESQGVWYNALDKTQSGARANDVGSHAAVLNPDGTQRTYYPCLP